MEKSKLWNIRIDYTVMFAILVGIYELVKWGISSFVESVWVSPIIVGIIFIVGLIYVDSHADDVDDSEDILDQPSNYIIIDMQDKTTKSYNRIIVERGAEVTKNDLSEIENEYEVINIFPAYVLDADTNDSDINKIKEMIEK